MLAKSGFESRYKLKVKDPANNFGYDQIHNNTRLGYSIVMTATNLSVP